MPQFLYQDLNTLWEYQVIPRLIPDDIKANLKPTLPLRPYQEEALARFFYYFSGFPKRVNPTQLLFHMATGSGKTLVMAAAILYLYQQGYRNFLFFVNSTNIIEKTRDNFLNPLSGKYLFADTITFGPKQAQIRAVDNFQTAHPDEINILFTTVQGLHSRLNQPRENSITYEDFAQQNIVLISDEAHHINALTKSQANPNQPGLFQSNDLAQSEIAELNTWEATVNRIFTARPGNLLLEFTATIELDNPAIAAKYADKILCQYDLKKFREDGYSKEVTVLQADLPPMQRALQAVVLSQYRRKVAAKHKLHLKPVILMKSRTIADSKAHADEFQQMIGQLNGEHLQQISQQANGALQRAFAYFAAQAIHLDDLAAELRQDFAAHHSLSVNSQADSEEKQLLVNSLEERGNLIRIIFAVDKLNEGWDVLNLFDIVRLYDTRDAKKGIPGKTTIAEAQLIGRGARYFPFSHNGQLLDQRKFDHDLDNEMRILESLYYHSAHNPRYIDELHKALIQTGIMPERSRTLTLRVKESFKTSDLWQKGFIFVNKRVRNLRTDVFDLKTFDFPRHHHYQLQTGQTQETTILDAAAAASPNLTTMTRAFSLQQFGENVIRTALRRLPAYRFDQLKRYLPHLKSSHELLTSADYLGSVMIDLTGTEAQLDHLSQADKLQIALTVLEKIGQTIQTSTPDYKGTDLFEPISIQHSLKDKTLQISVNEGGDQEYGIAQSETSNSALHLTLNDKAWYVYDENYGTAEEKYFVRFVHGAMAELEKRYEQIYLIRNEKLFTLYTFEDGRAFEPDFVLFAVEKATQKPVSYQLFIEPKGEHLLKTDAHKEQFLLDIAGRYALSTLYDADDYKLIGLPFYNETAAKRSFDPAFRRALSIP